MDQAKESMEERKQPITHGGLSRDRRWLIGLMREIGFGKIEGLRVESGEPVRDPSLRVVREIRLGSDRWVQPMGNGSDFMLKKEVLELLAYLDQIGDGTVMRLEIKHGLPFRIHVEERLDGVSGLCIGARAI